MIQIKFPVNLPWNESAKDSLLGRFILKNVYSDVKVNALMPDSAFIDSMLIDFTIFSPESIEIKDSLKYIFCSCERRIPPFCAQWMLPLSLTSSLTRLAITARMRIPKGTRMRVINDLEVNDPDYNKYIGRMIIGIATNYRLNAKLDWEVLEDVNMDLGSGIFELPAALRYVRKLEQRSASFNMYIRNHSNLYMYLYALVAPNGLIDSLDSMSTNDAYDLIINKGKAEEMGFVNLLGSEGVLIPPRYPDTTIFNSVELDNDQLETILSSDTCSWRWWLRFVKQDRDAMLDTDYIKINSFLHVEGINNTDSLVSW